MTLAPRRGETSGGRREARAGWRRSRREARGKAAGTRVEAGGADEHAPKASGGAGGPLRPRTPPPSHATVPLKISLGSSPSACRRRAKALDDVARDAVAHALQPPTPKLSEGTSRSSNSFARSENAWASSAPNAERPRQARRTIAKTIELVGEDLAVGGVGLPRRRARRCSGRSRAAAKRERRDSPGLARRPPPSSPPRLRPPSRRQRRYSRCARGKRERFGVRIAHDGVRVDGGERRAPLCRR